MLRVSSPLFRFPDEKGFGVFACDLDGTLIVPRKGRKYGGLYDWKPLGGAAEALRGLTVVVFTNQSGLGRSFSEEEFVERLLDVSRALGVEISFFVSKDRTNFRKPMTGMWKEMVKETFGRVSKRKSIFVGDAAGRDDKKGRDFSSADLLFARNVGLKFKTPEEAFWGVKGREYGEPKVSLVDYFPSSPWELQRAKRAWRRRTFEGVSILVGFPASGKSTFARNALGGETVVGNDLLGSEAKTLKALERAVGSGRNVVVDNTSLSYASRKKIVDLVAGRAPITVFLLGTPFEVCKDHLNWLRAEVSPGTAALPDVAFYAARKRYEEPREEEGFKVVKVPWVPSFSARESLFGFV